MLVLSRSPGSSIKATINVNDIPNDLQSIEFDLAIVDIRGDKARIGLQAPDFVRFTRDDAKNKERKPEEVQQQGGDQNAVPDDRSIGTGQTDAG